MKIGLISDTHYGNPSKVTIPDWIKAAFNKVDMIIHAGDIESRAAYNEFSNLAPFYAVKGNCDFQLNDLPQHRNIEIGCGILTVAHRVGHARSAMVDNTRVLLYGHTHLAVINQQENLLVVNPGSPSMPRGGMPPSVALLTVEGDSVRAELRYR
ncbi:MAG: YfcE family phosphodiesterase [Candidatus Rifleibacteriota bacterium]